MLNTDIMLYPCSDDLQNNLEESVSETDVNIMREFTEHILANVVGRLHYKKNGNRKVSEWANVSDEAFALLLLENSEDVWLEEKSKRNIELDNGRELKKRKKGNSF